MTRLGSILGAAGGILPGVGPIAGAGIGAGFGVFGAATSLAATQQVRHPAAFVPVTDQRLAALLTMAQEVRFRPHRPPTIQSFDDAIERWTADGTARTFGEWAEIHWPSVP